MGDAHKPTEPVCALRDVGKSFGGIFACRHVDLEVMPGEVLALTGENGAGKSTSVKCLVGLHAPTEGHVEIGGRAVELKTPRDGDALGMAMIPQELDLFPELSIVENLFVGRDWPRTRWRGFDWPKMRREARSTLASLGVTFDVTAPVKHLSAANGKLVEIARALMRNARVVVMDEPTAALTDREVARLFCDHPRPQIARHRHHLHQPPARRDLRHLRPHRGASRRRAPSHRPDRGLRQGEPRPAHGRAPARAALLAPAPSDRRSRSSKFAALSRRGAFAM